MLIMEGPQTHPGGLQRTHQQWIWSLVNLVSNVPSHKSHRSLPVGRSTLSTPPRPARPLQQQTPATPSRTRTAPQVPASPSSSYSLAQMSPGIVADRIIGGTRRIFRCVRTFSGVIGHEYTPTTMNITSSLNYAARYYLWAHGYQPGTISLIQEVYERAESQENFSHELYDNGGIPVAQGEFIYWLIRGRA